MRRTVLVTGAGAGIGLATTRHLAERGFDCVAGVRTEAGMEAIATTTTDGDGRIVAELMDVTDPEACERVVATHTPFAVVNNAGFFNAGLLEDVDDEAARAQLEAMVVAPVRLARLALPHMRDRGEGRIVNVTSAIIHASGAMTGWYQASKQALDALTTALRIEVAGDGIEVVAVEPASIDTQIWRRAEEDLERRRATSRQRTPYDRSLRFLRTLHGHMHPAEDVATAIGEALTARRPRSHYRVGGEGTLLRWASRLAPPPVRDRLLRTLLDLPNGPTA